MIQFKQVIPLFTLLFLGAVMQMSLAVTPISGDDNKPDDSGPVDTGYINSTGYFQYEFPFLEHRCDYENLFDTRQEWEASCYYQYQEGNTVNPCLIRYDNADRTVCARCKYGAVRIFTTIGIFCGAVFEDTDKIYVPPGPDEITFPTDYDYAETDWSMFCRIDPFFSNNFEDGELTFVYAFVNQTTSVQEMICGEFQAVSDPVTCDNYQATIDPAKDWATISSTTERASIYRLTLGCRICKDDAQMYVDFFQAFGIHLMQCKANEDIDPTAINEPCGPGKITAMQGAIESLEELECVQCSTLIPKCLSCNSTDYCDLCDIGFRQARLRDSSGQERVMCLYNFCGITGAGDNCDDNIGIDNCVRSESIFIKDAYPMG